MPPHPLSRRRFLSHIGVGAVGVGPLLRASGRPPVLDRVALGIVGVGSLGGGGHHLGRCLRMNDIDVLAVCDADSQRVDRAVAKTNGRAQGYRDFRRLLERSDLDAVLVVTPDHWHALHAVHACEAGFDVYCEKPLSLTVAGGREMANAARRYGTVFQVGTQQRSDKRFRWACELVRNGELGKIREVRVCIGRGPEAAPMPNATPPTQLDWNMWLGPAPAVPYNQRRSHYTFRWFWDYSGGKMTDWGAHHHDIAQWALDMEGSGPREVEAEGVWPQGNAYETPVDFKVRYVYDNGVVMNTVSKGENGITFVGERGELFVSRGKISATAKELLDKKVGTMPIQLYESTNHHANFVQCIKERRDPASNVDAAHRTATVCHIGNIAMQVGRKLSWDPEAERFTGDDAANRLLAKPMRRPWSL
ncbi:MAG: Gfo/Idh/MocA family oxidoreductase [Planctomycetota bacterium]|nr:Gfo/Idh/MocA family oxidoreductase [Planctomycetota bacterium]